MVNFSPKSLLRHPLCVSPVADFTTGGFKEVIDDVNVKVADVKRVVFCSGKVYYDLLEAQKENKHVAVVRVEQLYPTPVDQMEAVVAKYKNAEDVVWVQEEPENQGAWPYLLRRLRKTSLSNIDVISRRESSSPATGYMKQHAKQQAYIVAKAFEISVAKVAKQPIKETAKNAVKDKVN